MTSKLEFLHLTLFINLGEEASQNKLDESTRQLRDELKHQGAEVTFVNDISIPEGARASEAIALGTLAVAILPMAIQGLIKLLYDWCLRGENRTLEIEIKHSRHHSTKLKISGDIAPKRLEEIINIIKAS